MKFTIGRESLVELLGSVIGAVDKKNTNKIMENALLDVSEGQLEVTTTDLEIELKSSVPADMAQAGKVTAPARKLMDIAKALPQDSSVQIEADDEHGRLLIKGGRGRFELATLPADSFPSLDDINVNTELNLPENLFKRLLDKTAFCMANQDVRYYLNGLLLDMAPGSLTTVSTDGHRLALSSYRDDAIALESPVSIIVPRKGITELSRSLDASAETNVTVQFSDNHLRVEKDNICFTSKLIDGKYPDYMAAVPVTCKHNIVIDRELLRDTLARVAILSNEKIRSIRVKLSEGAMVLQSNNPEQETAVEELDVNYSGDVFETGFNVNYLRDALDHLESESANLDFTSASTSVLIHSDDDPDTKFVVMPVRM